MAIDEENDQGSAKELKEVVVCCDGQLGLPMSLQVHYAGCIHGDNKAINKYNGKGKLEGRQR